ncbi:MAG TPA: hypothetical protein VME18_02485 [Acidobacteriaceae bacterium]|nr:hypothetical protein [Acidobacteriaceae bacterium]
MAADDGIVRIGTQVDVSGLRSGMEEAAGVVESSSQTMAEAMEAAKVAAQNLADAQKQVGAAAAEGSESAAAIIAEYKNQAAQAIANVASLKAMAAAQLEAADAASVDALATRADASAQFERTEAYGAARVGLAAMTGSVGAMGYGLARVAASSATLGPILQAAFVPIAAVAMVEIIGEMIGRIDKFAADAEQLATELNSDWLTGAVGQVNGLAEAVKQADDEILKLAQDADSMARGMQSAQIEHIRLTQGPAAAYDAEAAEKQQQIAKNAALLQAMMADQAQLQQRASETQGAGTLFASGAPTTDALKAQQQLKVVNGQIASLQQENTLLQEQAANLRLQAQQAAEKGWNPDRAGAQRADHGAIADAETTKLIDQQTKMQEEAYAKIAALAGPKASPVFGSAETGALTAGTTQQIQAYQRIAETMARVAQSTKGLATDDRAASDAVDKYADSYTKLGDAQVEAYDIGQRNANELAEAALRAQEATHAIRPLAAAQQEAALHTREYEQALAALNAQLQVYQQAGKTVQAAQTQNQIMQLQGAHAVQATGDQAAIQQQIAQPWLSAFQQINDGWLRVQNQMLFTTRNIGQDFAKMGQSLVIYAMDAAEKWLLVWAEKELMSVVLHQTSNASKTASDAATNATTMAQATATNIAEAMSYAAVGAAAAGASAAAIPVVGWAMAPGAAAAVYAALSGFAAMASFDTGTGYVPNDGIAMLHQGEAVIPAPTMEDLRGSSGTGDISITQQNHFHGFNPDKEFQRQLYRNSSHIAAALQRHMRQAGRS